MDSYNFVLACRLYNKALNCQRYIINVTNDYFQNHSLSQFVKSIPLDKEAKEIKDEKASNADVFFQKAVLATFNKLAKKKLFKHYSQHHPELRNKLNLNYNNMIQSFDASQRILNSQNFCFDYLKTKDEKEQLENNEFQNSTFSNPIGLSYFSDFIFMQQLMTLEVDIIMGQTELSMKHLDIEEQAN